MKWVRKHRVESTLAEDFGFLFRDEQIDGRQTGNAEGLISERPFPGDRLHDKYRPMDVAAVLVEGEHRTFMSYTLIPQLREAYAQATPEFLTLASTQYTARDGIFYKDMQGMLRRVVPTPELQSLVLRTLHRESHHNSAKSLKQDIRSCALWWPGLEESVRKFVHACPQCKV